MNIKVEEKKLNIKINQETKKIEVSIIDNSDKIDLNLTNYDDTEVRQLIEGKQPRGNYLTEETDPTVPDYVKSITQQNIITWNNKADMSDIPDVSNFITKDVNNLTNYTLKTDTGSLIDLEINDTTYVVTLKLKNSDGTTISTDTIDLPLETVVVSGSYDSFTKEVVLLLESGSEVRFSVADLVSGLQSEITSSNKLASDLVDDSNSGNKFVTTSEKTTWNGKYTKPSGGIPKTDLTSEVQTSLGKADTAVQKDGGSATQTVSLSSGTGTTALGVKSKSTSSYISFSGANTWIGSIGVTSDKKPTFYNGSSYMLAYTSDIPTKTSDLTNDSGYITSYTETDPTVPSHVKNITQANITSWNNKSDFSGNYNDLTNKPTIPSEVTESTVSGWGFTKNTGTYSKPSGGIPKTDLESSVQTSLGKADTALQSHQDISGKADKTALQDISINTNSPMPSFDDMEVLDTYEFDISDTNYHPIYTLPNNGLNYIDTDITVAYRLTVTGTNISEVADIIDVWHNPISSPLTTVLNRTLSTSAATSGVRYLRAVYPTSAYLNDTTYPLGQEIASYNATARHIKIEVFKQPSNITWKSASENSIYINTTYNGSSSVTLYTTRGWIFRSPQSFVATSASSATYVSSYEPATIGSGAIKTGATAISANHFVYLADNGLVYDISNTTANISAKYKKVGVLTTAVAKNTAISTTYFRTVAQLTSTMIGTISHDTLALGRMVFLRCTIDSSGNIHSNNYLATSMSAGYTWLPIGVATASNTINMDTRGQHFYTLGSNGKLTHLDGIEIATGS